ncbi:MAG: PKD domain-containing protein [Bacteroidota bacterium]
MIKNITCLPAIILTAFILNGCSKNDDKVTPLQENNTKPEVNFTFSNADIFAPDPVSFANTTTNASSYKWYFGDGYSSGEGNPVHIYAVGGAYTVKLVATGQAGTDSSTQTVSVLNAPTTLKITTIFLTDFSFTKSTGANWDLTNGPDVYFKITNSDSIVYYDGISLLDSNVLQSDLPLVWNLATPYIITDFSKYKAIKIYDYDFPNPDEYIGKASFTPSTYATAQVHYPDTINISTADVFITLSLKWH